MRTGNIAKLALAGTVALSLIGVSAGPAVAAPTARPVAAPAAAGALTSKVDGTFAGGGIVTGTFTPARFVVQQGKLVATGTLHSVLTSAAGAPVGVADTAVTLPVVLPAAGGVSTLAVCNVLNLVLGPLDLNLLGLVVHLNTVVLNITGQTGALVGNLLCALAGLLNGGINLPVGTLAALLNAILALLGL